MIIDGMEVEWGEVLWCEDCEEIMDWDRVAHYWTCPSCEKSVFGRDLLESQ